jgi:hypothetical protein
MDYHVEKEGILPEGGVTIVIRSNSYEHKRGRGEC